MNDTDPDYYEDENHGYWLLSPDYEFQQRMIRMSDAACKAGIACSLEDNPNYSDIPF
ncbi:hypothetical protein [Nostoc sp. C052]|uniref:hypothetical protein n=1 Tax=Nostoc sp. C052 TaxID=2576902 RepID=UPI0015C3D3C5|nr:hypothetical protein [Nostoc sp. C052]